MEKDRFEQRLDDVARQWQSLRYQGPAPAFQQVAPRRGIAWGAALAAAMLAAFLLWPATPEWPEDLRPVLRGSPMAVEVPKAPASLMSFRLPDPPARSTCFSQTDACDQPAG